MRLPLDTFHELMAYHYDRREWVYRFVAEITPEDFVRPMNVGWESIRSTLVHCLYCEDFWVQHRLLKKARPVFEPLQYPDVACVARAAGEVRSRTWSFVAGLTDEDLGREESAIYSSGTTARFTVSKVFLHVITHDTHHRGQVVALARQLGYEPPELDLL